MWVLSLEYKRYKSTKLYFFSSAFSSSSSSSAFVKNPIVILAKVPILKFTDSASGLEVDLNVNNIVGIRNTQLVECYTRLDWRVQPLVLTFKKWARQNGINDAHNKTISSYTIVLMVIHYLQCKLFFNFYSQSQYLELDHFDSSFSSIHFLFHF